MNNINQEMIYTEVQREYDMEDARAIVEENDLQLSEAMLEYAVRMFRKNHDWTLSEYDQLKTCIMDAYEDEKREKAERARETA